VNSRVIFRRAVGVLSIIGLFYSPIAMAKDTLLAETKVIYKSEEAKAQLWGKKVNSGYANSLSLVLKRYDGTVITGYLPDIKGGYGAVLKAVQVKAKDSENQQLLLGVRQGDWRSYNEYRIFDISNPKKFEQIFAGNDNFGVIHSAKLENNSLFVQTVRDKAPVKVELNPKLLEDVSANRRKVAFGKLFSLAVLDLNQDGVSELISNQQITVDNKILADVGAVWRYKGPIDEKKQASDNQEEKKNITKSAQEKDNNSLLKTIGKELEALSDELKGIAETKDENNKSDKNLKEALWKHDNLTIMKADLPNKKNSINKGAFFLGGMVYPVKLVAPIGEATYPQIMLNENVELENNWNNILMEESDSYIKAFLQGRADLAYNVIRADKKLVTIQLISGKDSFVHHNISFIPGEKEKYELGSLLNIKSKDLIELLNVLNKNEKITWDNSLTTEWYMRDDKLFLMKNINGIDEVSGFALPNLRKYIIDKRFMSDEKKQDDKKSQGKKDVKDGIK